MGVVLGVALGLRVLAAASATPDWMWWTTPFGWIGFLHEVDQARGRVFLGFGVLFAVLLVAVVATARRDLHAGVSGTAAEAVRRPRRPVGGPVGLAVRLLAGPARTWGLTIGVVALAFALLARDFAEAVAALPATLAVAAEMGFAGLDRAEGIIAWAFSFIALLLAVFAAGQVAAIRDEEATWRLEHLLVRPVSRLGWLASRVLATAAAVLAIGLVAGAVAWLGTVVVGVPIAVADGLLAGVNAVPIAWLALGLGIGVFGLLPRATAALTYGLVVAAFVLDFVGPFLDLPEGVLDLSPFRHLAPVPAADGNVGAALVMVTVAVVAGGVGMVAFRRRDLQEA
jgi:ABC-2 type transport system permease protein